MARTFCLKKAREESCTWTSIVSLTRFVTIRNAYLRIYLTIDLKGLTFDKPELVPFRLTQNMIDAFGAYGYNGESKYKARRGPLYFS